MDTSHPTLIVVPPVGHSTGTWGGPSSFHPSRGDRDGFAPLGSSPGVKGRADCSAALRTGRARVGPACRHRPKRRKSARHQDCDNGGDVSRETASTTLGVMADTVEPSATARLMGDRPRGIRSFLACTRCGCIDLYPSRHIGRARPHARIAYAYFPARQWGVGVEEQSTSGATEVATGGRERDQWSRRVRLHVAWAATNHAKPSCGNRVESRHQ